MPSYNNKLGKKLHEKNGAKRTLNIFWNDFNPVYPNSFGNGENFPLEIRSDDECYNYDFQWIKPAHEIVSCLSRITEIPGNSSFWIMHEWYNTDNEMIFRHGPYHFQTGAGDNWAIWIFSYIGYCDWELNKSGECRCVITVTGDIWNNEILYFNISNVVDSNTLKHDAGYFWLDNDYKIHYTDYWGWEHNIPAVKETEDINVPGFFWLENDIFPLKNVFRYIDTNGDKRRTREAQEDIDFPQVNKQSGYFWIENGYHGNYLSFISNDGKRYIIAGGVKDDF